MDKFSTYFNRNEKSNGYFQLLVEMFRIIYLSHVIACINHYVCCWEVEQNIAGNWLEQHLMIDKSILERYLFTLCYMVLTCITAGVLQSASLYDQLVFIFAALVLATGFAQFVNSVGDIMSNMNYSKNTLRKNI